MNQHTWKQTELSNTIAERLKKLRITYTWIDGSGKERRLSYDTLAEMLTTDFGIKIEKTSLQNYEAPAPYHNKAFKNLGMNVEYVNALASFYNVTTDYILGREDLMYNYDSVEALSEALSLSRTATENLMKLSNINGGMVSDVLSRILESPELIDLLKSYNETYNKISHSLHDEGRHINSNYQKSCEDLADGYIMRVGRKTEDFLREILGFNKLVKDGDEFYGEQES